MTNIGYNKKLLVYAHLGSMLTLFLVWLIIFSGRSWDTQTDLMLEVFITFSFGAISAYLYVEFVKVKGRYDRTGIAITTPWAGAKSERWDNLKKVTYSSIGCWYVLKFESGTVIRLSILLSGTSGIFKILKDRGFNF